LKALAHQHHGSSHSGAGCGDLITKMHR
jgi:hypothetical protein